MTLARGEEQERGESCSFFCFYYPFSSSTFILSTAPFYCYPIVFSLIASCSLSHTSNTFQYPRSPAEHLEGRGRTWASTSSPHSATTAMHGCNHTAAGLDQCSEPPTEAGEGW